MRSAAVNQCRLVQRFRRVSLSLLLVYYQCFLFCRNHETVTEAAAAALAGVSRHAAAEG